MPGANTPVLNSETERVEALRQLRILDSVPEEDFDALTKLASAILGVPIALVSLLDSHRQWFKSAFGLEARETPIEMAFCAHAIRGSELFEIPDASQDERFLSNPLVTGEPNIRFYAGMPVASPDGIRVGTLCVIDRVPRRLDAEQSELLRALGRQVESLFRLRSQVIRAETELALRREAEAKLLESQGRFRAFMDHSPAMAFLKGVDGNFAYVNRPLCERFGIPETDWLGRNDIDIFGPEVAYPLMENDRRVLRSGRVENLFESIPTPDGEVRHWQSYKFPLKDSAGELFLGGMAIDVTVERRAEDALRASEIKYRSVIERLGEGVYLVENRTGLIVESNSSFQKLLGYSEIELRAMTPFDIFVDEDTERIESTRRAAEMGLNRLGRFDLGLRKYRRKNGDVVDVEVQLGQIPHGERGLTSVIVRDVTERLRYESLLTQYQSELESKNAKLLKLATTDALTGLNNRMAMNERLDSEFRRAVRYEHSFSIILLDVDHFKTFNDTFGHPAGDDVLRIVADLIRKSVRDVDFAARYGGEEFAVLLPDTDRFGAIALAERFRAAIANHTWKLRPITISVGISSLVATTGSEAEMIREADRALYQSKHAGRNRVNHGSNVIGMQATMRG